MIIIVKNGDDNNINDGININNYNNDEKNNNISKDIITVIVTIMMLLLIANDNHNFHDTHTSHYKNRKVQNSIRLCAPQVLYFSFSIA